MKPIHTFVVLAYKESQYLEECIKSVLNQSYKSKIVIATSTPNQYISKLAKKYKLEIIENPNPGKGIGYDFDFAISCGKTPLVTVAHQDDIYDQEYAKEIVSHYEKAPDTLIINTDYYEIKKNQKVYSNANLKIKKILLLPLRFSFLAKRKFGKRLALRFGCSICCPSVTFAKEKTSSEVFKSNMKCDIDWLAWERLSKKEGRFTYVNRPLMGHRVHEESTTTEIIKENIRTKEDYEMFCKFWPKPIAKVINHIYKNSEKSNNLNQKKGNKKSVILLCFLISFLALLFCSKCSPLYPMNDWVDFNCFFTVGKSWGHGVIPYLDIYEHKGPLLYFIFLIASIISSNSLIGVFLLEILSFTIFLYYCSKIIDFFIKEKTKYSILPILGTFIISSTYFMYGGSAEEFCLPLLSFSCYKTINFLFTNKISNKDLWIQGIIAGCIFMIKFTILGFWFAQMMCIFFILVKNKEYKKSIISCVIFLLGMALPFIAFSLYFIYHHGFMEMIEIYILKNIFTYNEKMSLGTRVVKMIKVLYQSLKLDYIFLFTLILSIIFIIFNKRNKAISWKVTMITLMIFTTLGILWGCMDFRYYYLILTFFSLFGFILILQVVNKIKWKKITYLIPILSIVISILLIMRSENLFFMKYKKEDLVQYKFAKIINKDKNPSLLNVGFIDGGFYYAADVIPNTYAFQVPNLDFGGNLSKQYQAIETKKIKYLVLRSYNLFDPITQYIKENYELIKTDYQKLEGINFKYELYKRKERKS